MGLVTTENLYFAAYTLTAGARLRRISVSRSNGRSTAIFEVEAPGIEKLSTLYYESKAVVNLAAFRNQLEGLRDELFRALRENESETQTKTMRRRDDEALRQGRAGAAQGPR